VSMSERGRRRRLIANGGADHTEKAQSAGDVGSPKRCRMMGSRVAMVHGPAGPVGPAGT
jgi:hypothetical protein